MEFGDQKVDRRVFYVKKLDFSTSNPGVKMNAVLASKVVGE